MHFNALPQICIRPCPIYIRFHDWDQACLLTDGSESRKTLCLDLKGSLARKIQRWASAQDRCTPFGEAGASRLCGLQAGEEIVNTLSGRFRRRHGKRMCVGVRTNARDDATLGEDG